MSTLIMRSALKDWRLVAAALIAVATVFVGLYVRPAGTATSAPRVPAGGELVLSGPLVLGSTMPASMTLSLLGR